MEQVQRRKREEIFKGDQDADGWDVLSKQSVSEQDDSKYLQRKSSVFGVYNDIYNHFTNRRIRKPK